MSYSFTYVDLLESRSIDPEHLVAGASATVYTIPQSISHLDSLYGIWTRMVGVRGGGDVTVQPQQSTTGRPDDSWSDVGAPFLLGAGGVFGGVNASADVETFLLPPANTTFKPFMRLKITTAAATEFNLSHIYWTRRGIR